MSCQCARARLIVDRAAPFRDAEVASVDTLRPSRDLRRALKEDLELGGDARKNLEGLVAVFSPLIGALLSRLGGL